MTDTTTTEVVEQLPIEAVIPDPGNRKVTLDKEFVASIRTHGIIQPLLVTPHAEQEAATSWLRDTAASERPERSDSRRCPP